MSSWPLATRKISNRIGLFERHALRTSEIFSGNPGTFTIDLVMQLPQLIRRTFLLPVVITTIFLAMMASPATAGCGSAGNYVILSWNASPSQDVVGYNVYRGKTSGGPYRKINRNLHTRTRFTDCGVVAEHTYYYVTTAVNSQGDESGYSNQAQAVIPPG